MKTDIFVLCWGHTWQYPGFTSGSAQELIPVGHMEGKYPAHSTIYISNSKLLK